ncbi:MAG TPA: S8 family serine peptidase [Rubrivivax sp.]|nr:S8 family serine peptidase [Rubrivivax sp.]
MKRISRSGLALAGAAFLVACGGANETISTQSTATQERALSARTPPTLDAVVHAAKIDRRLRHTSGPVDVWVTLDQNSLARTRAVLAERMPVHRMRAQSADGSVRREAAAVAAAMSAQRAAVLAQQAAVSSRLSAMGARVLGQVTVAHNAIAVTIDAGQLRTIGTLPGVARVRPVIHYEKHLSDTVPYIGALAVQSGGVDGSGVKVAVLDSGIDYTHRNLGGSGTAADYAAASADPTTIPNGLFPTAKVVGGYDFVGSTWSPGAGTRTEDANPIDDGPEGGHGTHVADIIAGKSLDGSHKGVAPGAQLLAIKVCSSVSTSCNGVALMKGMDYALDPDGDGDLSDAADVINLSLGSSYGQIEDDLSAATANAVAAGVVVVASAGNSADRPYITASPAATPGVISVAQTQVPSASAVPLKVNAPAAIAGLYGNTALLDWAPLGAGVSGDVVYVGRGCIGDSFLANPAGKIALIDRGVCAVSEKVDKAANAGAIGTLIALIAPGDAVSFSLGGGSNFVPSMVIQQSLGVAIRGQLAGGSTVNVSLSPANSVALVGSMAGTSSRGPNVSFGHIKPEIGAPGASMSAEYGTGNGETAFGGTSGAAPMVSGAAALLLSAFPGRTPMEIKAMLMNSANTAVYTNPAVLPGSLAPISRIGAGETRVDRALALPAIAWDDSTLSAALSYGALEVDKQTTVQRTLTLKNFGSSALSFSVGKSFRYASDAASGAVTIQAPGSVSVPAYGTATLTVSLLINPAKLPDWTLNGGALGGDGAALNGPEYDGYVTLTAGTTQLSIPWHVLPRKAALLNGTLPTGARARSVITLKNSGTGVGEWDSFSLIGTSGQYPPGAIPGMGDNYALIDLNAVGVRFLPAAEYGYNMLEFAISTHGRRAHPNYPAEFDIYIDTDGDGSADYVVYNAESGGFGASGQNRVYLYSMADGTSSSVFYTDADLNSGNLIFTVLLNTDGLPPSYPSLKVAAGTTLGIDLYGFDNYFTGAATDAIEGMRFTPGAPRYSLSGWPFGSLANGQSSSLPFAKNTAVSNAQSSETGLLLMYRRNAGVESRAFVIP